MRSRWAQLAALLVLAAATREARAAEPGPQGDPAPPQGATPEPAEIAGLLPPGARPAGGPADWAPAAEPAAGRGAQTPGPLVELLERATGADARERIEVEYTIDPELEARIRELLRRAKVELGDVVLMDPGSGALLAYVATDPVAFPVTRIYPTASLAKVVTAAAVLRRKPEAAGRGCRYLGSPYTFGPTELVAPRDGGSVDP